MSFLDRVQFPNTAIYNIVNKEGGSKCAGIAEVEMPTQQSETASCTKQTSIEIFH